MGSRIVIYVDGEYFKIGKLYITKGSGNFAPIKFWVFLGEVIFRQTPQMRDSDYVFFSLDNLKVVKFTRYETLGFVELP